MRRPLLLGLLLVTLGASASDPLRRAVRAGLADWRAGDATAAAAAFRHAEELAGETPPAELCHDLCVVGLATGDLELVDRALGRWGELPDAPLGARRAFAAGCRTLLRAREEGGRARSALGLAPGEVLDEDRRATLPGEVRAVVQRAMALTDAALGHWREAERLRGDWPAARRNAERALLDREALRDLLPPPPPVSDDPERRRDRAPQEAPPPPDPDQQLTPEDLQRLLEQLAQREREREERRRERRGTARGGVERDW